MITNIDPPKRAISPEIGRIQHNISQASNQVSSGLQITVASDSPDQIGTLLQLRANQLHNTQVQANLTLAQTNAQAADNALGSSIQLMDTATSLATQGATATRTPPAGRPRPTGAEHSPADGVQQPDQRAGPFIFSGDQDGTPQYTWDAATANPAATRGPAPRGKSKTPRAERSRPR